MRYICAYTSVCTKPFTMKRTHLCVHTQTGERCRTRAAIVARPVAILLLLPDLPGAAGTAAQRLPSKGCTEAPRNPSTGTGETRPV